MKSFMLSITDAAVSQDDQFWVPMQVPRLKQLPGTELASDQDVKLVQVSLLWARRAFSGPVAGSSVEVQGQLPLGLQDLK